MGTRNGSRLLGRYVVISNWAVDRYRAGAGRGARLHDYPIGFLVPRSLTAQTGFNITTGICRSVLVWYCA
jgi:hypothetical protein